MTFSPFSLSSTVNRRHSKQSSGFTLIELLVVISIISLLSTIILASVSTARARARDAVRLSDIHQLQIALEMYRIDNGVYPLSDKIGGVPVFNTAVALCVPPNTTVHDYGTINGYIPGLVSKYISILPEDPLKSTTFPRCYAYISDGIDYMIMITNSEVYQPPDNLHRKLGKNPNAMAIFTPNAVEW